MQPGGTYSDHSALDGEPHVRLYYLLTPCSRVLLEKLTGFAAR